MNRLHATCTRPAKSRRAPHWMSRAHAVNWDATRVAWAAPVVKAAQHLLLAIAFFVPKGRWTSAPVSLATLAEMTGYRDRQLRTLREALRRQREQCHQHADEQVLQARFVNEWGHLGLDHHACARVLPPPAQSVSEAKSASRERSPRTSVMWPECSQPRKRFTT